MPEVIQQVVGLTPEASIEVLTPEYIRTTYLAGLSITDENGLPYPDTFYYSHIRAAVAEFERVTKVMVLRRTITDEKHDYQVQDYQAFCFISLFQYPVISVEKVVAQYPTGQTVLEFPTEWVKLENLKGQIQLVPTQGTLSQVILGRGGNYLPILYGNLGYLPQLFHIDYTAGFADGKIPWDIIDAIGKMSAINILSVLAQTILPLGVTSMSTGTDGLSQSLGFMNNGQLPPVFTGLINMYRGDLYGNPRLGTSGILKEIREHWRGINLTVL